MAMTGDLFNLVHLMTPTSAHIWCLATEAYILGVGMVRILLECFLVS